MNGLNWWESLSFVLWKLVYIVHQSLWFPKSKVFLQYSPFQINFGQCSWACFFPTHWCSSKSTTFQICRVRHLLKLLLQCLVQAGFLNVTFSWHNVNYMLYLHKKLLIQAFKNTLHCSLHCLWCKMNSRTDEGLFVSGQCWRRGFLKHFSFRLFSLSFNILLFSLRWELQEDWILWQHKRQPVLVRKRQMDR